MAPNATTASTSVSSSSASTHRRSPSTCVLPPWACSADRPRSSEPAFGRVLELLSLRRGPGSRWRSVYGLAVDLNPVENPYVGCGRSRDPAARPYRDRSRHRPGMVTPRVVNAFRSIGWGWGGSWTGKHEGLHALLVLRALADDDCLREVASARAALPPRSPRTSGNRTSSVSGHARVAVAADYCLDRTQALEAVDCRSRPRAVSGYTDSPNDMRAGARASRRPH
jgi:hypothetical protein